MECSKECFIRLRIHLTEQHYSNLHFTETPRLGIFTINYYILFAKLNIIVNLKTVHR